MQSTNQIAVPSLAAVSEAYAQWRASGVSLRCTPEHLQQQTVSLLPHFPKGVICKTLKISYSALKRWSMPAPVTDSATPIDPGSAVRVGQNAVFVPLPTTAPPGSPPALNPAQVTALRMTLPSGTALSATVPLSSLLTLITQAQSAMPAEEEVSA